MLASRETDLPAGFTSRLSEQPEQREHPFMCHDHEAEHDEDEHEHQNSGLPAPPVRSTDHHADDQRTDHDGNELATGLRDRHHDDGDRCQHSRQEEPVAEHVVAMGLTTPVLLNFVRLGNGHENSF